MYEEIAMEERGTESSTAIRTKSKQYVKQISILFAGSLNDAMKMKK